jgi:ankyrin repeat protein
MQPGTTNARAAILTLVLAISLPVGKAREMVKLLLKLGATSAQGDMNHISAFHYVVAENNNEALDILLEHDRPAALSVLSNMGFRSSGYYWAGINGDSPLTTSIGKGYNEMVSRLLSLGAKPTIAYDDWIKGYLAKNQYAKNSTPEQNMNQYKTSVTQPIIAAAAKEMGQSIEDFLAHGADANTLEKQAQSILQHPSNAKYQSGESLLDIVQKKLKALRKYEGEPESTAQKEPETLRDEKHYLRGLKEGSYYHWSALHDYQSVKKTNAQAHENYKKLLEKTTIEGAKEKQQAITKLIHELESAEKALLAAGAKTFGELHPNFPKRQENNHHNRYTPSDPLPYKTNLTFNVPDLNDSKRIGYHVLFEAAWSNDIDTIKCLTLAPWETPNSTGSRSESTEIKTLNPPLKIAVNDGNGFSPFSIAALRGHRDLARKIVDICITQYHKDDGLTTRQRWNMLSSDSDDEGYDDGENLPIFSELVSDKFTVDNLGEVSTIVKSNVMPLQMIEWGCKASRFNDKDKPGDHQITLLEHAVNTDDMDLLRFMIGLGSEQQALLAEEEDDQKSYNLNRDVFQKAIKLGRTGMLAYMIKTTGVGIPLNELIKKSGVEVKTKPKYYQGLTVGGRKRADWAQAPDSQGHVVEERIPPVLQAAKFGSVESVEWFMSDAPMRRYKEFAGVNQHDKRIRTLEESGNGFDKAIGKWLNAKSETSYFLFQREIF